VPAVRTGALVVNDHLAAGIRTGCLPFLFILRKETPVNEITSKVIRDLDNLFKFYTVVALLGAMTFISSIAVKSWIAAGISGAITLLGTFIAYRIELEIEDQKVVTKSLDAARREKVAQYYRKESSDGKEKRSNV
jgi:hypothetical protein